MGFKSKRINPDVTDNHLGSILAVNGDSAAITAGDIVSVTSTDQSSGFLVVKRALDGGAGLIENGIKFIAAHDIAVGDTGVIRGWAVEMGLDTSGDSVGDPVYLSDATAGARTTTAPAGSPIKVGHVTVSDASEGAYFLCPQAMANAV